MDPNTVSTRSLPEGASGVSAGTGHLMDVLVIQKKRREEEEPKATQKELDMEVESLNQRVNEVLNQIKDTNKLNKKQRLEWKDKVDSAFEKVERKKKEIFQAEAKLEKLEKEKVEQLERNEEMERQVQEHSVYQEIMEQLVKLTQFQDVESFTDHLEKNRQTGEQLIQRESVYEQIDHLRQQLVAAENQHHLLQLEMQKQLLHLQTELQKARSEAQTWEKKWNRIRETTDPKTLLLVEIKMAIRNLSKMTSSYFEGNGPVDMHDTEKQLDMIKIFIQDHQGMMKLYRALQSSRKEKTPKTWLKK